MPSLSVVVFTGGEPFLLGPRLPALVAEAKSRGFLTRCVTNGFWARTERLATDRVNALKQAGLDEINFSTGDFLAKFVPIERVIKAACAAADAGLTSLITVETFSGSTITPDDLLSDPRISERWNAGRLIVRRNVWIANSGVAPLEHASEHRRFQSGNKSGCETVLNALAVTPELKLFACCGLHATRIPELVLGDVSRHSLPDVLDAAEDDLLKMWLQVEGPERILDFLREKEPSLGFPAMAVHPCESCLFLFRSPLVRDLLLRHYKEVEGKVVERFMAGLALTKLQRRVVASPRRELEAQAGENEVSP